VADADAGLIPGESAVSRPCGSFPAEVRPYPP